MQRLLRKVWKIVKELIRIFLELMAGGIGYYIFMDSIANQRYIVAGAAIVLFFELFWMIFTNRLEYVDKRRSKK